VGRILIACAVALLSACTELLPGSDRFDAGGAAPSDVGLPSDAGPPGDAAPATDAARDAEVALDVDTTQDAEPPDTGPSDIGFPDAREPSPLTVRRGALTTAGPAGDAGTRLEGHGFEHLERRCTDAGVCVRGGVGP
jgi:hypothetical protein